MDPLDNDVLTEILLRLPVKSLLRFKCVSRRWNRIISDPEFPFPMPEKLLVPVDYTYECSIDRMDNSIFTGFMRQDIYIQGRHYRCLSIHGSCHGLVCVRADYQRQFFLYNPTTRQWRRLAQFGRDQHYSVGEREFFCGFGYDTAKDDYKILVGCSYPDQCKQIYSLRSNSWRSTGRGNRYNLQGQGMYSDGFLHWVSREREVDSIVSFDLATEEFRAALLPMPSFRLQGEGMKLSVTGGGSLVAYRTKVPRVEAWIMKDRGLNSTWTELCSFSDELLTRGCPSNRIYPLVKDGKTLLFVRREWGSIVICDLKEGSLMIFPLPGNQKYRMTSYVKSLVSVHVANRPNKGPGLCI